MTQPFLASSSIALHLARGFAGLVALVAAFVLIGPIGAPALALLVVAGIAWRGCPSCWAIGLAQTCEAKTCRTGNCGTS